MLQYESLQVAVTEVVIVVLNSRNLLSYLFLNLKEHEALIDFLYSCVETVFWNRYSNLKNEFSSLKDFSIFCI